MLAGATRPGGEQRPPLAIDLDGTLIATDTLLESFLRSVKSAPATLIRLPFWLLKGRAALKRGLAERGGIDVQGLPYRRDVLSYLSAEKQAGRRIILATAADRLIAIRIAEHLGLFEDVLASDGTRNLKGPSKLEAIRARLGPDFVYAGDSVADLPIWQASKGAILVAVPPKLSGALHGRVDIEQHFTATRAGLASWAKGLRLHQWVKNILLFVPLLTSFEFFAGDKIARIILAFVAFSIIASGTYVLNDLWDLESDRRHPRKQNRPFASGAISISAGLVAVACMIPAGLLIAYYISPLFFITSIGYLMLTSFYSLLLKKYVMADVLVLSSLYTFRILSGSLVAQVPASSWLLVFSFFFFLSLALVKRCSELISLSDVGVAVASGRDYRASDMSVLKPFGVGAALSAMVVFGLFVTAPETASRYATPQALWVVAIALAYWLSRLWIKTARGEMNDDPIVFALKDKASLLVIATMLITATAAHFISFGQLLARVQP